MKLTELFPEMPTVTIGDIKYEVKFNTRAILQLEKDYPNPGDLGEVLKTITTGMKVSDLVNVLFAGLLHTKVFKDKDAVIDVIEPREFNNYADAILAAYMRSSMSAEQLEKLEVLSQGSKKKAEPETSLENTPSIG